MADTIILKGQEVPAATFAGRVSAGEMKKINAMFAINGRNKATFIRAIVSKYINDPAFAKLIDEMYDQYADSASE